MIGKAIRPIALGALALTAAYGMALAEQQGGGGHGGGGHGGGAAGHGKMGGVLKPEQRRAAMTEGRIAFLKSALGIKENQLKAWNAYADTLRAQKSTGRGMRGSGMMGSGMMGGGKGKAAGTTAMQQIDKRIERMEASIADLKALKPRADALYKLLDDDQKKKANALLLRKGR